MFCIPLCAARGDLCGRRAGRSVVFPVVQLLLSAVAGVSHMWLGVVLVVMVGEGCCQHSMQSNT